MFPAVPLPSATRRSIKSILTLQENAMNNLTIKDLPVAEDLDREAMTEVHGGRMKLPFQRASVDGLLTSPDGEPVSVYVDGVLVNSVTDGYVHV
jgi:hypothetical protein